MRSNQIVWTGLARRPGVAVLLVMLVGAEIGLADRFPPDPVEELRHTLKTAAFEADLAELQRDLPKRIEALRTVSDMYRALAVEEWPEETYVPGWRPRPDWDKFEAERWETWSKEGDNKIVTTKWQARIRLAQSFESKARALLKSGTTSVRLALLDLLAETGPSMSIVDYPEPLLKGYRKGVARALSPDIAALVNDADSPPQVRETAADRKSTRLNSSHT